MKIIITLLLITVPFTFEAEAQTLKPELVEPAKRLVDAFDSNLKTQGWTRERGTPIEGTSAGGVVIEFWRKVDRVVKVSLVLDPVGNLVVEARRRRGEETDGLERAIIDGYCNSLVSFYQGRVGIFVWTETHTTMLSMNEKDNTALSCAEDAATSRLMACFVNLALSGDLNKRHLPGDGFLSSPCEQELVRKGLISAENFRQF